MRLLDLFCGAGGAAMGYHRAGFEVVGVDNRPQPRYPFEFHCDDAFAYLEKHGHEFDVIHASPPCQAYSLANNFIKKKREHPKLVDATRTLLQSVGKDYVIENVVGSPVRRDLLLCGTMFGFKWHRHRLFETSQLILRLQHNCIKLNRYCPGKVMIGFMDKDIEEMGFHWMEKRTEKREAIPPAYTEWIGRRIMEALNP